MERRRAFGQRYLANARQGRGVTKGCFLFLCAILIVFSSLYFWN